MNTASTAHFDRQYQRHLKHLKLKGLQPKTIEAYSRAIRRIGEHFEGQIDDLTEPQLTEYFTELMRTHGRRVKSCFLLPLRIEIKIANRQRTTLRRLFSLGVARFPNPMTIGTIGVCRMLSHIVFPEAAIADKIVTYGFVRLMEGATEASARPSARR